MEFVAARTPLAGREPTVWLLNVQPPLLVEIPTAASRRRLAELYAMRADSVLRPARRMLTRAGLDVRGTHLVGVPGLRIARVARSKKVDLIVMGSRGRTAAAGMIAGYLVLGAMTERLGVARSPLTVDELLLALHDPRFPVRFEAIVSIARRRPDPRPNLIEPGRRESRKTRSRRPSSRPGTPGARKRERRGARRKAGWNETSSVARSRDRARRRLTGPNSVGRLTASDTPVPFGPRNRVHCAFATVETPTPMAIVSRATTGSTHAYTPHTPSLGP